MFRERMSRMCCLQIETGELVIVGRRVDSNQQVENCLVDKQPTDHVRN